ncbi:Outer membrane channel TolC (OpmH) [hydrothermal vent metagenome]|uniref:Outer membrane channel TolC (OpmH) n=1 Tax=hydrothermal vent metagenome TaxID=652676 RepID=A0A3B0VRI0_9ZZZZ
MKKLYLSLSIIIFSFSAIGADLSEIFQQSEAHDPQLSAAKHTLNASAEGKKQAFAAFLPQITGSWTKTSGDNESGGSIIPIQTFDINTEGWNIGISQALYDHANYGNYKISKIQVLQAIADYDVAYQDFVLRVAQSYFDVLGAKDSLIFSQAEEKAIQRQLDQAEQRFEVGLAAITDVHEARARYDGARAAVIIANNQLDDTNEALFEISQRYYDELLPVPDDINFATFSLQPMELYQELAIAKNPNLASSQLGADIAEKQISVSRAGHYPSLSLTLSRSHSLNPNATFPITQTVPDPNNPGETIDITTFVETDQRSESNTASIRVNVPIYSGGRTQSQVRQRIHNHKSAMDRSEQTRRNVIRKVRNAYHGTIAAKSSVEARKQAMISAQSGLEATEAGYEVGTRTIVDVLNSQRSLYQAQRDYSRAKYDYFIQYLGLQRAAGSLAEEDILVINKILK